MADETPTPDQPDEPQAAAETAPQAEEPQETPQAEQPQAEPETPEPAPAAEPVAEAPSDAPESAAPAAEPVAQAEPEANEEDEEDVEPAPRQRPAVPGADLEVDIVPEGVDPLASSRAEDPYAAYADGEEAQGEQAEDVEEPLVTAPIEAVAIDLAAGARYRATGKRKTAIARVMLQPGSGSYTINGRTLAEFFPRETLQRNIRQPLETVGYEEKMDVTARLQGGGVSAQAGALRHGISRALLEADPNLRGELKRRGFLTRDARAKERKKAGLKKARKRPQFSKR
jgi:small subunit ribosomal protein S9